MQSMVSGDDDDGIMMAAPVEHHVPDTLYILCMDVPLNSHVTTP